MTTCFVIGPIGDEFAPHGAPERLRFEQALEVWEKVIEPACATAGLEAVRADMIAQPGEITEQVFIQIRDADLVIADVTGGNPNVMYELGLRHTRHKATIQLGEHGQLPFDISAIRTLRFARTPVGLVDARKKLTASIVAAIDGAFDPVTATRLWNPTISEEEGENLLTGSTQPITEDEQPGFLELLSEMESALPELNNLMLRATQSMESVGGLVTAAGAEIKRSDEAKGGFAGRLRIANRLATDLSPIADELEAVAEGCEARVGSINAGMTCLLDLIEQNPTQAKEMEEFASVLQTFVDGIGGISVNQSSFAAAFAVPAKFSKPMRVSVRRIVDATGRMVRALNKAEIWNSRLHQLILSAKLGPTTASIE